MAAHGDFVRVEQILWMLPTYGDYDDPSIEKAGDQGR
jgi:hypothetical protein